MNDSDAMVSALPALPSFFVKRSQRSFPNPRSKPARKVRQGPLLFLRKWRAKPEVHQLF